MKLIAWIKRRRVDSTLHKVDNQLHRAQIHEVEKHAENLKLRSQVVAREIERRKVVDPWGQTIAGIARNQK